MNSRCISLRGLLQVAAAALALFAPSLFAPTAATSQVKPGIVLKKAGKYAVELRLPKEGLAAELETDVELHVADMSQDDPVQGPPPVVKAKLTARVTMPSMAGMPAQSPKTHAEGVPGDYGVVLYFPHGGDYQLDLTVNPPGDKPFTVSYKLAVGDALTSKGRTAKPKPFTLEVVSDPAMPQAGKVSDLSIVIRDRDTKLPVTDFDTVHEKQIHFMVVSADLQYFAHEHPVLGNDGKFTLQYTFPTGGEYHLFADVAPRGAGSQIIMQPIRVSGPVPPRAAFLKFSPSLADTQAGVKVSLAAAPAKFPVGRALNISFTLKDTAAGAAVTDLEPYLGAMAHLMLIHQDGATFVHSHPDETDPTNGHKGSLTFLARFPKPGFYRGWLQFQRGSKVETTTFTWEVRSQKAS